MTPHPHAPALHALIDGEEVQVCDLRALGPKKWQTVGLGRAPVHLTLEPQVYEWRLKPKVLRYRVALLHYNDVQAFCVVTTNEQAGKETQDPAFMRWLGDWQEVEA